MSDAPANDSNEILPGLSHSKVPAIEARKRERDLLLLEKDIQDCPDHPFVLFNIGMTVYHLKDYAQAQAALEQCLAVSKPQEPTVRKVYAMLAGCHLAARNLPQAIATVDAGLRRFPNDPELLLRASIIYSETGERDIK